MVRSGNIQCSCNCMLSVSCLIGSCSIDVFMANSLLLILLIFWAYFVWYDLFLGTGSRSGPVVCCLLLLFRPGTFCIFTSESFYFMLSLYFITLVAFCFGLALLRVFYIFNTSILCYISWVFMLVLYWNLPQHPGIFGAQAPVGWRCVKGAGPQLNT